jgi:lysophospholipase L1-like esterase
MFLRCGLVLGLLACLASPAVAADRIYLSLGDSLSVGIQPNANGNNQLTNEGYADQLHQILRLKNRNLQLVKLGCPDETTDTMINGGIPLCSFPAGSQLKQAVAFLQANRSAVSLVTIDIGANDLLGCVVGGIVDTDCVLGAFGTVGANLPTIIGQLRAAAPGVPIVAMNYYNPLVASWLQGPAGQLQAQQSAFLLGQFNDLLESIYGDPHFRVPVADVARAFRADDFTIVPGIGLPVNVLLVCQLTWMCAPPPVGPNIHANRTGYFVIALMFAETLR